MAVQEEAVAAPGSAVHVRYATPADAETIALLSQELFAFYGLPVRFPRSYLAHVIAETPFTDPTSIAVLMAFERGQARGFLAFSNSFAVATCPPRALLPHVFVPTKPMLGG